MQKITYWSSCCNQCLSENSKEKLCIHVSACLHQSEWGRWFNIKYLESGKKVSQEPQKWLMGSCCFPLTSHVPEVNGLSVGVQQLDHRVVVVLHSTADDGRVPLHHRHVICHQVLTHNWIRKTQNRNLDYYVWEIGGTFVLGLFWTNTEREMKEQQDVMFKSCCNHILMCCKSVPSGLFNGMMPFWWCIHARRSRKVKFQC